MAKRYLKEIEEVIGLLKWAPKGGFPAEATAAQIKQARLEQAGKILKQRNLTLIQFAQVQHYLDSPGEQSDLFKEYAKIRSDRAKRFETDGDARKELSAERGYQLGKRFLERWQAHRLGETLPDGGRIPGFPGHGQQAVAGLLSGGPQVDP
jgi:hypothetical protein